MKKIILSSLFTFVYLLSYCGEGMWLPFLLGKLNEQDMKSKGLKISAEDIYSTNKNSLKDAIVSLGGFCTAEVISNQGLILTNHHCGFDAIQNHSTVANNYLKEGFWAKNNAEEKTNPGLFATFIIKMEDVSEQILTGVNQNLTEKERQSIISKNISSISGSYKKEPEQDIKVVPFYDGNQYILFVTETYSDVRLVGAPPSSIGKFGSDTDNWVWPRHTGDFSLFRIYAGKNNKPAKYSPDNVPYVPKQSLKISLDGVEDGDFTMVYGFPGRTQEYLPSVAVNQVANVLNPIKIQIRENTLESMNVFMRVNEQIEIQYASKYASIANYWKKWIGESQGIRQTNAVEKKQNYEKEFTNRIQNNPTWNSNYSTLLTQLNDSYKAAEPYYILRDQFSQIFTNNEMLTMTLQIERLIKNSENDDEKTWQTKLQKQKDAITDFYKEYNADLDRTIFARIMPLLSIKDSKLIKPSKSISLLSDNKNNYELLSNSLYDKTAFKSKESLFDLLDGSREKVIKKLKKDKAYIFATDISSEYYSKVDPKIKEYQEQINKLQRSYIKAQMEVFTDKKFFPDANSTLRLTYGNVAPYNPRDAVNFTSKTYLDGVMEKYKPGDYEFDLPKKLIDLYKNKDYGIYTDKTGKVPVCFIGSNHTTGGNSGSPALDANGNLIGLNFDRVWEGTMSDINYDPSICRNIMVDARYILFIIDKYANATNIIKELEIVHPKKY